MASSHLAIGCLDILRPGAGTPRFVRAIDRFAWFS
jgi:hypothetical protein